MGADGQMAPNELVQHRRFAANMLTVPLVLLVLLWILLAASATLFGQDLNGTLRGIVLDPQGKAVPDAKVTATNESNDVAMSTMTTAAGVYAFPGLSVGSYTLQVQAQGFSPYIRKGIQVLAAQVTGATANIAIGTTTTQVLVESGADIVQTESAQLSGNFTGSALSEIPIATGADLSVLNLVIFLPNTTSAQGGTLGTGGSVGGLRLRQNGFSVDGVDNNDPTNTGSPQPVIPDAVQEFTVNQNVFNAEYGRGSGGQFTVITKAGTNQLHLGAWAYNGNRAYDAADNQEKMDIRNGVRPGKRRYDFNRVGGEIGGPVLRDKLFLYAAYEFNNLGQQAIAPTGLAPTAAGMTALNALAANSIVRNLLVQFPVAPVQTGTVTVSGQAIPVGTVNSIAPSFNNQQDFLVNGDWNLRPQQSLHVRYLGDRTRAPFFGTFPQAQFASFAAVNEERLIVNHVWTATARLVNDFKASVARFNQSYPLSGIAQSYPNLFINDLAGILIGPNANLPQRRVYNRYLFGDAVSWTVKQRHTLKFGGEFYWYTAPSEFLQLQRGEFAYLSLNALINDQAPFFAFQGVGNGFFSGNSRNFSLFLQDDIRVNRRLTLNAGLRYDFFGNPADAKLNALNTIADLPGTPLVFGVPKEDRNNFAPRLGFTWDPTGAGKWVVRGGGGVVYDWIPWNFYQNSLPIERQVILSVVPPFTSSAICLGIFGPPPAWCTNGGNGFFANGAMNLNFVPPSTVAAARAQTIQLMADAKAPKVFSWSLGVQREVFRNTSVELRYLGTRALELPVQLQLNSITPFDVGAQPLPTYIHASDVPGVVSGSAPTLAQFLALEGRRYAAQGFTGGPLTIAAPVGASTYHGGSVELLHRFDHGLLLRANYTYSKTMDDSTNELASSLVNPRRAQDSYNLRGEWARSALDVPHKVAITFLYDLPRVQRNNRFAVEIVNGWEWSGSFLFQSGQPVTIQSGVDSNGNLDSVSDRAILNPTGVEGTGSLVNPVCRDTSTGATSINASCPAANTVGYLAVNPNAKYVQAGVGAQSNLGRNTFDSPSLNVWNMAILRTARIGERANLQFRVEAFDVFNHRNFAIGTLSVFPSSTNALNAGYASLTSVPSGAFLNSQLFNGGSRRIQLGLKVTY